MTHMDMNPFQVVALPWLILLLPVGSETQKLCLIAASTSILYISWVVSTINQITSCLGISCLTIKPKSG